MLVDDARVIATNVGLSDIVKIPTNLDRVITLICRGGAAIFCSGSGAQVKTSAARMVAIQIKDANASAPLPNAHQAFQMPFRDPASKKSWKIAASRFGTTLGHATNRRRCTSTRNKRSLRILAEGVMRSI